MASPDQNQLIGKWPVAAPAQLFSRVIEYKTLEPGESKGATELKI